MSHLFDGKSSLRPKAEQPDGPSKEKQELETYLREKYASSGSTMKKKKRKERKSALKIVDRDVSGFTTLEAPVMEAIDPDGPVIVNEREAAAAEKYQQKQKMKAYYGEGGWAQVEDEAMEEDLSPPRHQPQPEIVPHDGDLSPSRTLAGKLDPDPVSDDDDDMSPPRRNAVELDGEDNDLSPPRQPLTDSASHSDRKKRMLDGTKTGVLTGQQLKEQVRKKRKEDKIRIHQLGDEATGRFAETVYRNERGKRVTLDELKREEDKAKNKTKWEKVEWDSGLVQQRESKRHRAQLAREVFKPFARSRDDEDLNAMYKAQVRWGDPMSQIAKKQKPPHGQRVHELTPVIDETNRHWFEKSGFTISQEVPEHSWIRRGVAPVSNRYSIRPGRHWDGVDRSNGFEKEYAKYINEQAAKEKEAAMWTMEDILLHRFVRSLVLKAARDAGVDYVCFTDADCLPTSSWIESLTKHFDDNPSDDIISGITKSLRQDSFIETFHDVFGTLNGPTLPDETLLYGPTCNMGVRLRTVDLKFNTNFPEAAFEDVAFCVEARKAGATIRLAPTAVVLHDYQLSLRGVARQFARYGRGWARMKEIDPHFMSWHTVSRLTPCTDELSKLVCKIPSNHKTIPSAEAALDKSKAEELKVVVNVKALMRSVCQHEDTSLYMVMNNVKTFWRKPLRI